MVMGGSGKRGLLGYSGIEEMSKQQQENDTTYQMKWGTLPDVYDRQEELRQDREYDSEDEAEKENYKNECHARSFIDDADLSLSDRDDLYDEIPIKKKKVGCCETQKLLSCMIINHRGGIYTFWHESIDALCIVSSFIYMHFAANRG